MKPTKASQPRKRKESQPGRGKQKNGTRLSRFHDSADIYDFSLAWKWRVLRASLGTTEGAVIMAIIGKTPALGPCYGETCDILPTGIVVTKHRINGKWTELRPIGSIVALRDSIRRLADHCKLPDNERVELFAELSKWVRKDYRAVSTL